MRGLRAYRREIHRKPGCTTRPELFIDPEDPVPLAVAPRLARKALGMRYLMDVVIRTPPWYAARGRPTDREEDGLLFITRRWSC